MLWFCYTWLFYFLIWKTSGNFKFCTKWSKFRELDGYFLCWTSFLSAVCYNFNLGYWTLALLDFLVSYPSNFVSEFKDKVEKAYLEKNVEKFTLWKTKTNNFYEFTIHLSFYWIIIFLMMIFFAQAKYSLGWFKSH